MSALRLALASWAGLILLHLGWHGWWAPPLSGRSGLAIAFTVGPLLLPLLALRRGPLRATLWVGVLSLFYFCHGVVAAWSEPRARAPALLEVALCLLLVAALGWHARRHKRTPRPTPVQ